jgi:hypothetical protein
MNICNIKATSQQTPPEVWRGRGHGLSATLEGVSKKVAEAEHGGHNGFRDLPQSLCLEHVQFKNLPETRLSKPK